MLPSILDLQPSRQLRYWTIGIHLAAIALVLALPIAPLLKAALTVIILAGFWRQYRNLSRNPIRAIYIQNPDNWKLALADGQNTRARLRHSIVFPRLVVLYLEQENGKTRSLLLPEDSLPPEQHRRLRAALRLLRP